MADDHANFELIRLLDLPAGTPLDERLWRWSLAFEAWLEERRTGFNSNIGFYSHHAWCEFLAFTGKPPWEVSAADVNAYIESLEARGLRPGTISGRLTGLSSFYAYFQQHGLDPQCGPGFNPVKGAQRPKNFKYDHARYLSEGEEAALLQAARGDDWPISKRDYALILTLLRTGWKAGLVRQLKWREIGAQGAGLPAEVWQAIRDYLQAAGRLECIRDEDYIFAPTNYHLFSERRERAEDWDSARPLTSRRLLNVLKQHARLAGLKAEAINCNTLRHTAAMRLLKSGQSPDAVGRCLGRKWTQSSRVYLKKLQETPKARLTSPRRDRPMLRSRKPHRFQPRNHMMLTHGLYARYLPEFEWLAEQGVQLDMVDAAELRWRIVVRRANFIAARAETLREAARQLKAMGTAAVRLASTLKLRREFEQLRGEIETELDSPDWWGDDELPPEE